MTCKIIIVIKKIIKCIMHNVNSCKGSLADLPLRHKRHDEKHEHVKQDHQTNIVNQLGDHKLS